MIISYKHNFVFVKTRKTAGTSMEVALSTYAGPDDVITPFGVNDEHARYLVDPNALARNFSTDPAAEEVFRHAVRNQFRGASFRSAKEGLVGGRFYNHITAARAKRTLNNDAFWDGAFKFTIERHPYEKAVSLASMLAARESDFARVLDDTVDGGSYRNFQIYSKGDRVLVDFFLRHEDLAAGLRHVEEKLGIEGILSRMPRAKSKFRRDHRPAREILDRRQREKVQEICKAEFELLGYEP